LLKSLYPHTLTGIEPAHPRENQSYNPLHLPAQGFCACGYKDLDCFQSLYHVNF